MFSLLKKTNSLLKPDFCSLNSGKNKNNKLSAWSVITTKTNELTFRPNQLTQCGIIQLDTYCTEQMKEN